jgi:hypothetical protein
LFVRTSNDFCQLYSLVDSVIGGRHHRLRSLLLRVDQFIYRIVVRHEVSQ